MSFNLKREDQNAVSSVLSELLIFVIIFVVVLILYIFLKNFFPIGLTNRLAPPLIRIINIIHTSENGKLIYDSRVVIQNTGTENLKNRDLRAQFYRNHNPVYAVIDTLNGHDFIPSPHNGVQKMGGKGCSEDFFSPGEMIKIDFTDNTFHPGDIVEVRIYQKADAPSHVPIQGCLLDSRYMNTYLQENVYHTYQGFNLISQDAVVA